jgi:alkane 1-monooxygenase
MSRFKALGFLLVFVMPALLPLAAWLPRWGVDTDLAAWFPLLFLFVLLPIADYAIGRDRANPDAAEAVRLEAQPYYRWLTLACLPAQLLLLVWSGWHYAHAEFAWSGRIGWLLSQGIISSVLAINVAHELIHKRERLEPWAGGALLSTVCYFGFKIEHVRGHHVHVSTPQDASSARLGQNTYAFVLAALWRNTHAAWRLEAQRLRARGLSPLHWRNELLWWALLSAGFACAFGAWLGAVGVLFFLAQSAIAAMSLEIINFVEHYGLERREIAPGRYERTTHLHSWNSSYLISNLILFQLQRHSDHHEHARRRYQALLHHDDSPQLPGGYPVMYLLALCPPLWRRVIHPRVARQREGYPAPPVQV